MTDSHPEHRRVKGKNITRIMPFLYKVRLAMTTTLTGAGPGGGGGSVQITSAHMKTESQNWRAARLQPQKDSGMEATEDHQALGAPGGGTPPIP